MRHSVLISGAVTVMAILLAACVTGTSTSPTANATHDASSEVDVRVMSFNIEWGGTHVSFANVVAAIKRADADVVGIQEAEGNLDKLAAALGWHYDLRNYVVSRYPLLDPPGADGKYVFVEVRPGNVVAIANLHLPSDPYGPDLVRDGASLAAVLANENRVRLPVLRPFLDALDNLVADGVPVIVTGDFNSPAHTDWTESMVDARPYLKYAVRWPVSLAMQAAGFTDAWRAIHPDVAARPGLTWWAGRPPLAAYAPDDGDPQDRIDQIWYAGPVAPLSAVLVGEPDAPEVTISVSPWPSDHRAVVADFRVEPAPLPRLLTTDRHVYSDTDRVVVTYALNGPMPADIAVVDLDTERTVMRRSLRAAQGRMELPPLPPGAYRLSSSAGGTDLHRTIWVLARDARPAIEVSGKRFASGDSIHIRWRDGPGHRNDYIAVYAAESAADIEAMLAYAYVGARPEGSMPLDRLAIAGGWSPSPGIYRVRLMKDDGYEILAESGLFEIH